MEKFFNIRYEFDKREVMSLIDKQIESRKPSYVCVADGVILNTVNRDEEYQKVVDDSMFSICDSSWVPIYVNWIYGYKREQYCGAMIFRDLVEKSSHRMFFMGTKKKVLEGLKKELTKINPEIEDMTFYELPFCNVEEFDYPAIAKMVEKDGAKIIWVALGAPKQELFMNRLKPYLKEGVMIAVGAAFKFYSGLEERRAPESMRRLHLEFLYRIILDPKKQLKRCAWIILMMPKLLWKEWRQKRQSYKECID